MVKIRRSIGSRTAPSFGGAGRVSRNATVVFCVAARCGRSWSVFTVHRSRPHRVAGAAGDAAADCAETLAMTQAEATTRRAAATRMRVIRLNVLRVRSGRKGAPSNHQVADQSRVSIPMNRRADTLLAVAELIEEVIDVVDMGLLL